MPIRQPYNRILLLWLLAAIGFALAPAQSFASCEMNRESVTTSLHACCAQKPVCACEPPTASLERPARTVPGTFGAGCPCVTAPQPGSPAPSSPVEPLRLYVVAALPVRAGPLCAPATVAVAVTTALPPVACPRFIPPSPPRAPPF